MYLHLTKNNNAVGKTDKNLSWETKFKKQIFQQIGFAEFCLPIAWKNLNMTK